MSWMDEATPVQASSGSSHWMSEATPVKNYTVKGAGKNLLMDAGRNAMSAIDILKRGPTGAGYTGKTLDPKEAYSMLQGMKEIPGQMLNEVKHPIDSLYEKPISTALDFATLGEGGLSLANAARPLAEGVAKRTVPGLLKSTAGVPEMATERAISRPEILKTPAAAPEDLSKFVGEPITNAIRSAKTRVQGILGKAYQKYAGMQNPVNELIENPTKPSRSFEQLTQDYKSSLSGDYAKKMNDAGGMETLSDKDKLASLTQLKREIQAHTNFNKAPITLQPIDTVKDAALKKMGSEVDAVREQLPNGKRLSAVDNAYKAVNDIYDTVQKDLSDPAKAKDTMMRLLRGDNTWLTSGKMSNKVSAVRKAELMTGQKVLEPALDELTRQVFSEWTGKGFTSQVLRGAAGAGGAAGLFLHNPAAIPAVAGTMAMSSPRVMGAAIRGAGAVGEGIGSASAAMRSPALAGAFRSWMDSLKHKGQKQ